ncbi:MAG: hypothetical protein JNM70_24955 [Anaerolineae bacterium]|nr:hypothetical protein [Anaerolineae bacterium]
MSIHAADREADDDYRAFIDAWSAIDELHAIRTAGPVMPEAPSEASWDEIVARVDKHIVPNGRIAEVYHAIRAALAKEQACSTQVPPNHAPHTPTNAADGAVSREHQRNTP